MAESLAPAGTPFFCKGDVGQDLDVFAKVRSGILRLANCHDALGFPDEACRLVVLTDLLNSRSLQERFTPEM